MRALRLGLAVGMAAVAVAGCLRDDTGAVLLHLDQRTDVSAPATYSSSTAAASFAPDGPVHLTATSNQGVVTLLLAGPLRDGATIELPHDEERLHFAVGEADWGNRGGTIVVLSASPVILSFVVVPMEARSDAAAGAFVVGAACAFD